MRFDLVGNTGTEYMQERTKKARSHCNRCLHYLDPVSFDKRQPNKSDSSNKPPPNH